MMTVITIAMTKPESACERTKTHGGIGVPRTRFRTPRSRRAVMVMATFTAVADTIASVRIPGTYNVATFAPLSRVLLPKMDVKMTRKMSGRTTVKNVAAGLRRKIRRSKLSW